jgi:hypothetical protein
MKTQHKGAFMTNETVVINPDAVEPHDRCGVAMNILNVSGPGCCDSCEAEMNEQIAANPDVVFAFERGALRAVA